MDQISEAQPELKEFGTEVSVYDPVADTKTLETDQEIHFLNEFDVSETENRYDGVILAVAHSQFQDLDCRRFVGDAGVVYDVKSFLPPESVDERL